MFEFLRRHLLGEATPERPPVRFYLQKRGAYLDDQSWPPRGTRFERLHLGDGSLSAEPGQRSSASYFANPSAGISMAFNRHGTVAATPYVPTDQQAEQPQGLTFRTRFPGRASEAGRTPPAAPRGASSSANDTDWYAKLADVAPGGSQTIISEGALRASHRRLDPARSTAGSVYHTHTSPKPITPGQEYAYDFEIWPTAYELAAGHRLQLRITSTDFPTHFDGYVHADRANPAATRIEPLPPATNTLRLGAGGSWLELPLEGGRDGGIGLSRTCLARRAPIGPRNIGRVRLGFSRRRLLRRVPAPRIRSRRAWRWCVKGGRGRVTAVFNRKGRVALVATTAPRHGNRRIHPGTRLSAFARAYPRRRSAGRGVVRATPRSPRLFGLRRGRVRFVAVSSPRVIQDPSLLRSYLRLAARTRRGR